MLAAKRAALFKALLSDVVGQSMSMSESAGAK
jgi:hypothetical protein